MEIEKYLDGSKAQFMQFMEMPVDKPLKMLNLLKFKKEVEATGKSGAEVYNDYLNAAQPFFEKTEAKIIFKGKPQINLIGPNALEWDSVLIVEYANKDAFTSMVMAEGYPSKMRISALEDSRLIFCT